MVQIAQIKAVFSTILAPERILDKPQDLSFYGQDLCKFYSADPALVLLPQSIDEICAIVKACYQHKIALVPSGGRTGYSAGATATNKEVVLSLSRLNKILNFDPVGQTLTCQAGCITETIQNKAKEHGLFYPVDFASKGSSQIGGNLATNAGGIRVIRHGSTRDWVLGLKVVDGKGELLDLSSALIKNQSGYDLKNLLVGSEGTLGVIVEATLKLTKPPAQTALALIALSDIDSAMKLLVKLRERFELCLFEYFEHNALEKVTKHNSLANPFKQAHPCYVLAEVEINSPLDSEKFEQELAGLISENLLADAAIAQNSKQHQHFLSLRELISSTLTQHFTPRKNDLSVPLAKISEFTGALRAQLQKNMPQCEIVLFGHLGDGNIHLNILKPDKLSVPDFTKLCEESELETYALVKAHMGSISAEHGIGLLKKAHLQFTRSPAQIEIMRHIKKIFDPQGILNPGKLL